MNTINVLIAVDVVGAAAAGTLMGSVYLVDSNQYLGSWQEGQSQLNTVCQDGQAIAWSVVAVNPGNQVAIAGFSGSMLGICVPAADPASRSTRLSPIIHERARSISCSRAARRSIPGRGLRQSQSAR